MASPIVPIAPGVPPLIRNPLLAIPQVILLVADAPLLAGVAPIREQWGVFKDGVNVIAAQSMITFDYKQNWYVSDYPLEQGAFESYNKVESPFDARVRFAAGGTEANRKALLDSIAAIADNVETYDVVTPEVVYLSVTINHYDYRRSSQSGLGLITVDLWLTEVRVTARTEFTNTKTPAGHDAINGGTVQGRPVAQGVGSDYVASGGVQ